MNQKELSEILEKHKKWLKGKEDGERANLTNADLKNGALSYTDLSLADLNGAELEGAIFTDEEEKA